MFLCFLSEELLNKCNVILLVVAGQHGEIVVIRAQIEQSVQCIRSSGRDQTSYYLTCFQQVFRLLCFLSV